MDDAAYMKRAIRLARRGQGHVEPNPMVGCVIVKGGRIVGEGWHKKFGGPHAEIEALKLAGKQARGATMYVTLEPCCHYGKTPPCSDAVIAAGLKRVVVAAVDPFPAVSGKGIKQLEAAGIKVDIGVEQAAALEVLEPFVKRVLTGRPLVIAKWATTLDGALATSTGHSQWISSEASRKDVHAIRACVDAVIVGIGTARADDPGLTARFVKPKRIARRIVIDPRLELPLDSQLVRTIGEAPVMCVTSVATLKSQAVKRKRLEAAGVQVMGVPVVKKTKALDLGVMLDRLWTDHQVANVLVEGGSRTLGTFVEQGLVDELLVYIGAKLLGDGEHLGPVQLTERRRSMHDARRLVLKSMERIGDDVKLRYRL
jgi:diaminohydroxyphosphoribosylaminopyrimidine deaminase/5-amino-6-(5-phosphoribosylamino)uracil reductase